MLEETHFPIPGIIPIHRSAIDMGDPAAPAATGIYDPQTGDDNRADGNGEHIVMAS